MDSRATAIDRLLDDVMRREGGFVDHPADRGGPTNMGITLTTLSAWRNRAAGVDELKRLTAADAKAIYRRRYFEEPGIGRLSALMAEAVFDAAVHHGPRRAVRLLQETLNEVADEAGFAPLVADGLIGPATLRATEIAEAVMGPYLRNAYQDARALLMHRIAAADPGQLVFLAGWLRRTDKLRVPVA